VATHYKLTNTYSYLFYYEYFSSYYVGFNIVLFLQSLIQDDEKVCVQFFFLRGAIKNSVYLNNPHTTDDLKMVITEYIQDVNKCLETGRGHFEHYL
jgi:hypothetical protein